MIELLSSLYRYHHVLRNFILRDLRVKYRGTILGYLWSLLEPLSLVAIYWFVFVVIAQRGGEDYPLVVILGVLPFQFFNLVVSGGTVALVSNAPLIRRVYLPRELFVIAHVGSNLFVLGSSLLVAVPFLLAYGVAPGVRLVFLPVAIVLIAAFSTGIALVLSCINAIYRDVAYVVRVVLRLAFYASPVIYTVDMVPESIRDVYLLNPLAVYLSMARSAVMDAPFPFSAAHAAVATAAAILSLGLGGIWFRRLQAKAVKYL